MITKYMLLDAIYVEALEKYVNESLENGWKLYGPTFVRGEVLNQAMVKTTSSDDKQLYFDFMKEAPHA